jgi:hypothetical protein
MGRSQLKGSGVKGRYWGISRTRKERGTTINVVIYQWVPHPMFSTKMGWRVGGLRDVGTSRIRKERGTLKRGGLSGVSFYLSI